MLHHIDTLVDSEARHHGIVGSNGKSQDDSPRIYFMPLGIFGDRSFSAAGPQVWIRLPHALLAPN